MTYYIDHTDANNYGTITIADQTVNQETSLKFVGKNYPNYAQPIAENFLHLLENFAKSTPPTSPVIGQLWYDTNSIANPSQPQLKVWDGTNWVPAGNVKKSITRPTTSVIGDIWVDTANQQLYIWSGATWILVGPQFSEGTQSGPVVEQVYDILNATHVIIKFIVGNEIVAIISKDAFTPKVAIEGFTADGIKAGINISGKDFNNNGFVDNKLWGVADKASKLIVNGYPTGLAADNFLRGDVSTTANAGINIRNNSGLTFGSDLNASLSTSTNGDILLSNKTEGTNIYIRTYIAGDYNNVVTVSGNNVGINKTNPAEALDITGKIVASDGLTVTSTVDSTNLVTGSIKTAGGISIAKSLNVGSNANISGTVTTGALLPTTTNTKDIGSDTARYNRIYANTVGNIDNTTQFVGTFTGTFAGSVTGTATKLVSPTIFQLTGDVASNAISFTGLQEDGLATFTTVLSSDVITSKDAVVDSALTDTLLIYRPLVGLRKTTKASFLANVATVPTGVIFPFAGTTVPNGYVLCDGSEYLISQYPELYAVIGYAYKALGLLQGVATFAVPDLRGRFPLGLDSMFSGNTVPLAPTGATSGTTVTSAANRVTDVTADIIGNGNGTEEKPILVSNLPEHKHDLKGTDSLGNKGNKYYAVRNSPDPITDVDAVAGFGLDTGATAQFLSNSGGIDNTAQTDVPINVMNPYLTVNYIIFTGRII
jgi:microcystin-dependent protein